MGLVQLQSVAIYDATGAYYPVGGSTWEVGGSVGAALNFTAGSEAFAVFAEPGYTLRNVVSLDWGGQNSKTIPPPGFRVRSGLPDGRSRPASSSADVNFEQQRSPR